MVFSGEAYNVEMGISNELFQSERDENSDCQHAELPNDISTLDGPSGVESVSGVEKFAFFMRFLAPPTPSTTTPGGSTSIANGKSAFMNVGCGQCHTPTLPTGNAAVPALRNQNANLFSDLGLHRMGPGLADNIVQGSAAGDEFRTAPLWGLGQRIFFLHDGRTKDLARGHPGARERRKPAIRSIGSEPGGWPVQCVAGTQPAGRAELPAFPVDPGGGGGADQRTGLS